MRRAASPIRSHLSRIVRLRLLVGAFAVVGAGVIAAISLAIMDIYLVGHGFRSIREEVLACERFGIHLSAADLVLLGVVVMSAGIAAVASARFEAWRVRGRGPS